MSVHGEYGRYLSDLIDALELRDEAEGDVLSALRRASVAHTGDLSQAAERALEALGRASALEIVNDDERVREIAFGLESIARAILGRPSDA